MSHDSQNILVSTAWVADRLAEPTLCVLDASWYLPAQARNPKAEYDRAHVPGARFFAIDTICDTASHLPHMLPSAEAFSAAAGYLGIGDDDHVVVYDGSGLMSAARVWWMFRAFGHRAVAVMDGGFPKWRAENRPLEAGMGASTPRTFTARLQPAMVRALADMRANLESGKEQVVDARSPGRFAGTEAEPRPGLRGGHVPGSVNLPYADLLDPDTGCVADAATLLTRFARAGVDLERPLVTSCGSGVTAAVLSLALALIGHDANALYDGSWAEWGGLPDTAIDQ